MDLAERESKLQEIAREVEQCTACALHFGRKRSVPGEGPADAEVMFIGEGPGFHENEQGRPFVGAAGSFLGELLASAGLKRSQVFITNVVKSRPPNNRDPLPDELAACAPYMLRQIETINPRVIVTLGRFSMAHFMPGAKISEAHGKARWVNNRLIVAMYHPAAALHQPSLKSTLLHDFAQLPAFVEQARKAAAARLPQPEEKPKEEDDPGMDNPTQLSLF